MPPLDRARSADPISSGDPIWSSDRIWSRFAPDSINPWSIPLASARSILPGMQATDSLANFRLELYSARMEPRRSRRAAWICSSSKPHGPSVRAPIPAPPSLISSSSRLLRSALCCIRLLRCDRCGRGSFDRLLMRQLGRFVCPGGVTAGDYGVLKASVVGSPVALQRRGAVTLRRPFMVVGGGSVGSFGHSSVSSPR